MRRRRWAIVVAVLALGGLSAPVASAQAPTAPGPSSNAMGWYLAMGDSLAAGYQPGQGDDKTGGYVGGVLDAVRADTAKTQLVNVACSGETVVTMVNGGRCAYDEGTQLAQAVEFLDAHRRTPGWSRSTSAPTTCSAASVAAPSASTSPASSRGWATSSGCSRRCSRSCTRPRPTPRSWCVNYYNPFLAAYLTGAAGQALAAQSVALQAALN